MSGVDHMQVTRVFGGRWWQFLGQRRSECLPPLPFNPEPVKAPFPLPMSHLEADTSQESWSG